MEKKPLNLKLTINTESREVSLNGSVFDFSVDYNSIDKSDILNFRKYLMARNKIK